MSLIFYSTHEYYWRRQLLADEEYDSWIGI